MRKKADRLGGEINARAQHQKLIMERFGGLVPPVLAHGGVG